MGVAGGKNPVGRREIRVLLDREEQLRDCLIEVPSEEARGVYYIHGRQGKIDEIAATCLFLVSDAAGFITCQTIHVNGGAGYY
jgi:NAD(P)-dependent dehydrogenase (short-subunit alcohol dehydrogenase family)